MTEQKQDGYLSDIRKNLLTMQEKENENEKVISVDAREMSLMLEFLKGRNANLTVELAHAESKYALAVQYIKALEEENSLLKKTGSPEDQNNRDEVWDNSIDESLQNAVTNGVSVPVKDMQ